LLEVEVPIAASLAPRISAGSRVILKADGFDGEWTGRVVRKAAFVDPSTQSVPIFVSIPYDNNRPLYQGQYLRAEFPEVTFDEGFSIPRTAVVENEFIYTVVDGRLSKRKILILHAGDSHLIVQGIDEGQQVVTIPLVNVTENMRVEILN
jgi:multidrug efflux pump subunit AcrA (membrane-fusion protein)